MITEISLEQKKSWVLRTKQVLDNLYLQPDLAKECSIYLPDTFDKKGNHKYKISDIFWCPDTPSSEFTLICQVLDKNIVSRSNNSEYVVDFFKTEKLDILIVLCFRGCVIENQIWTTCGKPYKFWMKRFPNLVTSLKNRIHICWTMFIPT